MAAKADGNTIRTQRTRARILAEGLRLFNERGEAHVTTGMIAAELDMSPGNLYYHFRNKDQIVEQLFTRFEERIEVQQPRAGAAPREALRGPAPREAWGPAPREAPWGPAPREAPCGPAPREAPWGPAPREAPWGPEVIEDLWLYLHLMFEGIWEYRFLYRNLDDLVSRNRRLRERFNRIIDRKSETVIALCAELVRARVMAATPGQIRALANNVLVVATYWLNYQALRGGRRAHAPPGGDSADLGQGAYQVMALVAPYLLGEARAHLDRLGRNYID